MITPSNRAPFFTWVDEEWKQPADVPMAIRRQAKLLWLNGAKVEAIAECFRVPVEWAEIFCHDKVETRH